MPSRKQQIEQLVWRLTKPFLDLPPNPEGNTEYVAARRKIQKKATDPQFIHGLQRQYESFGEFLREYDINIPDIKVFLDMDMSEFLQPRQPRRKR